VEGVAAVENRVAESRSVPRRLAVALERLEDRAWDAIESLPLFVLALASFVLAVVLARLLTRWDGLFRWMTGNTFLRDLARQVTRLAIVAIGALLALEILDATALVGAVLGAAGVAGLAIGFAFRDLVENYIASLLLSLRQPFSPNDLVRIVDHEGRVARLTSRATILVTAEGNHVRIPNSVVFKSTIENLTRKPERRFSISVGVGVEEDLVAAQDLGVATLRRMDGVLDAPPPASEVNALGDSSVLLTIHGWVDQDRADFVKVKSEATRLVKQAFDRRGIEMPEPIHRLRIENLAQAQPTPQQSGPEVMRDVSRDTYLEELVRDERNAEADLLKEGGSEE
ncbi:MAG: mechanosensitive ion channel family protein, partial [Myxococcales bacterium]|nr:mechanosensitive ion channel family protein [Myxococcales bacterium]